MYLKLPENTKACLGSVPNPIIMQSFNFKLLAVRHISTKEYFNKKEGFETGNASF